MNASVKHISYYLPEQIFSNGDYFRIFPESAKNANLEKLGISKRHIIDRNETAGDLAVKSALKLFEEHAIDKQSIDFILFCSLEFDHAIPSTAGIIQAKLGLPTHCGALDFNLGCSGYVYGLSLAKGLIASGSCKNVLLLTASALSKTFHPKDKNSHYIFGDGAAATLISEDADEKIGAFVFGTDGSRADKIIIKDGGARNPLSEQSLVDHTDEFGNTTNDASFYMNGSSIFVFGLKAVPAMIRELLLKSGRSMDEIDYFVFHQANRFMNDSIRKKAGIPEHKFLEYMEKCGNTVASTIPIVLYESMRSGKLESGKTVLLAAFGSGLSWAGTIIKL